MGGTGPDLQGRDGGAAAVIFPIVGRHRETEDDDTVGEPETAWARRFLAALEPHRAGVYVNFLDADDDTSRVREAYGDQTCRRLAEVKAAPFCHGVSSPT